MPNGEDALKWFKETHSLQYQVLAHEVIKRCSNLEGKTNFQKLTAELQFGI